MPPHNPLLNFDGLPLFDEIQPCHIAPAIDQLLTEAKDAWQQVIQPDFAPDWTGMARVLGVATERLSHAWGIVHHLNHVADTPELRAAYNAVLPAVTGFWTGLGSDPRLYAKYKAIKAIQAINPCTLNAEQARALHNTLRDFALGGADLTGAAHDRFTAIALQRAQASQKFSENVQDATDAFAYFANAQELDGLPDDVQQTARRLAQADGKDGYKLTLQMPCYLPVLQFSANRALRERLYRAHVTRASDRGDDGSRLLDNTQIMADILALRHEQAQLLGYPHFGALSLVTKMADSPDHVLGFLRDLARRATPFARRDVADMQTFAADHLDLPAPQAWDWPHIAERLKQARHAFNDQEVRAYFPLPRVLAGLFGLVETLFDIVITPAAAPVWNPSVQFFQIKRSGPLLSPLGQFYLDTEARTGKRGGAWMDDVCGRWLRPDTHTLQTPVAHLVCNFAGGTDGQPPLLTHDDVTTLFHEFGHGLQHLLTQVDEREVSGINGVEWDAVELPSQFLENFCWEWTVLQRLSAHVQTGEPLPRALFDKMLAAKNFQSGLQTLRQIEFALFDMLLHTADSPVANVMPLLQQVRDEIAVLQPPDWSRTPHTFGHIFAGGYAAGYYSYKWAEVLSADAYEAFAECADQDGTPCKATGQRFLQTILESGGSRPAMDSFVAFRGRPPTLDALLRQQGLWQPRTDPLDDRHGH